MLGVEGSQVAKAPIDIRSLARSHCPEAINKIAGLMRECPNPIVRLNAAIALLNRGYGAPVPDGDSREHINITIRKILEGGAITISETTTAKVIEHEPTETSDDR